MTLSPPWRWPRSRRAEVLTWIASANVITTAGAREDHRRCEADQGAERAAEDTASNHVASGPIVQGSPGGKGPAGDPVLWDTRSQSRIRPKIYFPKAGITKLDLVHYYLAVADGVLRGVARRPQIMKRFVDGAEGEPFYQKRAPVKRPDWVTSRPSRSRRAPRRRGRGQQHAQLVYVVNLGCIDLNPHAVRSEDMDRPDELRIDLDPVPGVLWRRSSRSRGWRAQCSTTMARRLAKTSGSRGVQHLGGSDRRWPFTEVRVRRLAFAREVERRAPAIATAKCGRRSATACSSTTTRTRAIARRRARTRCGRRRMPACRCRFRGTTCSPAIRSTTRCARCGPPRGARRRPRRDRRRGRLDRIAARAGGAPESEGAADAPWPPTSRSGRARHRGGTIARERASAARKAAHPATSCRSSRSQGKLKADALAASSLEAGTRPSSPPRAGARSGRHHRASHQLVRVRITAQCSRSGTTPPSTRLQTTTGRPSTPLGARGQRGRRPGRAACLPVVPTPPRRTHRGPDGDGDAMQ